MNYYDVLEVPPDADTSIIRKAYLKKSLQHHPDKNPGREELVKPHFVAVGQAYETLSDPVLRRQYDQELRQNQRQRGQQQRNGKSSEYYKNESSASFDPSSSSFAYNGTSSASSYDTYRDVFDATVAGMSEAELAAAVGTVVAVAGFVGSLVGGRLASGTGASGRGSRNNSTVGAAARSSSNAGVLSAVGSAVGSMVASEVAASSVRALHRESVRRLEYKEECRRALARGEPIPEPPSQNGGGKWQEVLQHTLESVQTKVGMRAAGHGGGGSDSRSRENDGGNGNSNHNDDVARTIGNLWRRAAAGVKAATAEGQGANTQR